MNILSANGSISLIVLVLTVCVCNAMISGTDIYTIITKFETNFLCVRANHNS